MRVEVFPSPMNVAWHWRVVDKTGFVVAISRDGGYETEGKALDAIDQVADAFQRNTMGIVKHDKCPQHWRGNYGK